MPLSSTSTPAISRLDGFSFPMIRDTGGVVPVIVTTEALQDIASPPASDIQGMDAYRTTFEEIASDKFDRGEVDGMTGEIWIRQADVRQFLT
jgi:hypothetical protein